MAGWTCPDREVIAWDGTIQARLFRGDGSGLSNVAGVVFPLAIASGGTASTTAADARVALNVAVSAAIINAVYPLAIASGGTASTTAGDARTSLNVPASAAYTLWTTDRAGFSGASALALTYGSTYPIAITSGGTNAITSAAALSNLGIAQSGSLQTTLNDQSTSAASFYAPILYNTTSLGITASNYPIGSVLLVYTN